MLLRTLRHTRSAALAFLAVNLLLSAAWSQTWTETVLYSFTGGADGGHPYAGVIRDASGNLYGTTVSGGASSNGTVFKVTPSGEETVLYSFCSQLSCTDGTQPIAPLVFDAQGNLYGTTWYGGNATYSGTVFKVTPSGTETVLYRFNCTQIYCPDKDGSYPTAGLVFDGNESLYGVTEEGGFSYQGVIFKVTLSGSETVLHRFTSGADGEDPFYGLAVDTKGNLYGTTPGGGNSDGTVFKLTPSGKKTVLYDFGGKRKGLPAVSPDSVLIFDAKGNIYGTTEFGGENNCGSVYKLTRSGKLTTLYSFACDGIGGPEPNEGLVFDTQGNLYGTTYQGGFYGGGNVFELTPSGEMTSVHDFTGGADGANPLAVLVFDANGNLYGTTSEGGSGDCFGLGCGVVFELTP